MRQAAAKLPVNIEYSTCLFGAVLLLFGLHAFEETVHAIKRMLGTVYRPHKSEKTCFNQ